MINTMCLTTGKFASYNLHGFQQNKSKLLELCDSRDIIAIQQHWLPDYNLGKILSLHNKFTEAPALLYWHNCISLW